jgi:hypothetical protein
MKILMWNILNSIMKIQEKIMIEVKYKLLVAMGTVKEAVEIKYI